MSELTQRTFGVELEGIGMSPEQAAEALRSVGINAKAESYNHSTRRHWKVTTDASITWSGSYRNYRNTFEVVSPILKGEEGLAELRKVVETLNDSGADVNRSCGIHVHIGVNDLSVEQIKTILVRYQKFEEDIDAFMPKSRRGRRPTQGGRQCFLKTLTDLDFDRDYNSISGMYRRIFRGDRYYKINVHSYLKYGTLEFRHHSGSMNPSKVCNWVKFVHQFVRQSVAGTSTPARGRDTFGNEIRAEEEFPGDCATSMETIGHTFRRNSMIYKVYCHIADTYLASGETRFSVRSVSRHFAGVLTEGQVTRFMGVLANGETMGFLSGSPRGQYQLVGLLAEDLGTRAAHYAVIANRSQAPTIATQDTLWTGISDNLKQYYERRAAILAA